MAKQTDLKPGAIIELDPSRVKPFSDNPRKRFRGIPQLVESIRAIGQVTPIVVTRSGENGYDAELVDGERRLRACLLGGMPVKAVLDGDEAAGDRYVRAVAANFCRQGHDPVEILGAVTALKQSGHTEPEIAAIFGKTASWVSQYYSLRRLAPEVLEQLQIAGDEAKLSKHERRRRGRVSLSVAQLLVPLPHKLQLAAMRKIAAGKMGIAEARTFVHKLARRGGRKVGTSISHAQKFRSVASAVDACFHVVDRYLDLPGIEIRALIDTASQNERKALAKRLESLCESLLMLSDALDKSD